MMNFNEDARPAARIALDSLAHSIETSLRLSREMSFVMTNHLMQNPQPCLFADNDDAELKNLDIHSAAKQRVLLLITHRAQRNIT